MAKDEKPAANVKADDLGTYEAPRSDQADDYGQQGSVRDASFPDEKPAPDTVAQVQEIDE